MKNLFLVLGIAILFVVAGCKKDGYYRPQQKISKITYNTALNDTEFVASSETWFWDKDKLQKIVNEDGSSVSTTEFVYNNKGRLIRVENKASGEYTLYEYQGTKLDEVSMYRGGVEVLDFDIKYKGNKLSVIKVKYCEDADVSLNRKNNPLSYICSPEILQVMEENKAVRSQTQTHRKEFDTWAYSVAFEWTGNNISKMIYTDDYEGSTVYYLSYDEKLNPLKDFLGLVFDDGYEYDYIFKSKNNIKVMSDDYGWQRTYEYTYNGDYPATQTHSVSSVKYTTCFEYK